MGDDWQTFKLPDAAPAATIRLHWPKGLKTMKLERAYSTLEFKSVDEDKRLISGIASTPSPDRVGDIIESEGAQFDLPLPLLWHHKSDQPIGHVVEAKVSKKGINVVCEIAKVDEPGKLKDRIDEAFQSIKAGLVKGLSIGFKTIEHEPIVDSKTKDDPFALLFGPRRHKKWLWLELSAVTIPANGDASITAIKALDRAALGISSTVSLKTPPGASGSSSKANEEMKTIAEQIAALETTRGEKATRMNSIMQKSIDENRSTNDEERDEFDTLQREIETLDGDLKRLKALEALQATSAKAVEGMTGRQGTASRTDSGQIIVREVKDLPKGGIRMARLVRCLGLAQGNRFNAAQIAEQLYKGDPGIANVLKATVVAGSTQTGTGDWGGALVGDETTIFADFVDYLRPRTIVGRFGTNGVPALRNVPFRTALIGQTSGGTGYWVGEGKAKPLTRADFERRTLEPLKVAAIAVVTQEMLRDSSPNADTIIRNTLVDACRERIDLDFVNPDKAAVAGISPASIFNGVAAVGASTGGDADAIRADVRALIGGFIAVNQRLGSAVWIMSEQIALGLSLMQNPLGQNEFDGITVTDGMFGGVFMNLPIIASEYVTPATAGDFVGIVNASEIYFADEGDFQVDMSTEASLEMRDDPTQDALAPTAASLVSLWQTNTVGFRAERTLNWMRRRDSAVAWMTGVQWGQTVTGP